jgi:hypothetical protein
VLGKNIRLIYRRAVPKQQGRRNYFAGAALLAEGRCSLGFVENVLFTLPQCDGVAASRARYEMTRKQGAHIATAAGVGNSGWGGWAGGRCGVRGDMFIFNLGTAEVQRQAVWAASWNSICHGDGVRRSFFLPWPDPRQRPVRGIGSKYHQRLRQNALVVEPSACVTVPPGTPLGRSRLPLLTDAPGLLSRNLAKGCPRDIKAGRELLLLKLASRVQLPNLKHLFCSQLGIRMVLPQEPRVASGRLPQIATGSRKQVPDAGLILTVSGNGKRSRITPGF